MHYTLTLKGMIELNLEKIKELYYKGYSDQQIATTLNCGRKTIARRRKQLNLPPQKFTAITPQKAKIILQRFSENKSGAEICKELHISTATLTKYKKEHGIKGPFDLKLSEENKELAMKWAERGLMDTEIAKNLGVSSGDIALLRKHRGIESKFTYDKIAKIDNQAFEKLFYTGFNDKEIAEKLGMSPDGIYSHRIRHGYKRRNQTEATYNPLTQENKEILLGVIMGDGHISKRNKNPRISFAHCLKQKEYTFYLADKLSNLKPHLFEYTSKVDSRTGKRYSAYCCKLAANPAYNEMYEHFYKEGKKRIPIELFDNYTWQSLAYHFMDDGSTCHCGGQLATNCFTTEDLILFQEFLKSKFNIETTIMKSHVLYIKAKSFKWMKEQIKPYMCNCMMYKVL